MPWDAASQDGGPDRRRHVPAAVSRSTPLAVASYVLRWRRGCSCADWSDYRSSSKAVTVRSGGNLGLDLRRAEAQIMLASESGGS
jgi:hypothetical protein